MGRNRPTRGTARALAILTLAAITTTSAGIALAEKLPRTTEDGLELTPVKGVDVLYRRPGASLSGYTKVMLASTSVAFSKSWNPRNFGTFGLSAQEVTRMRSELAKLADKVFTEVLSEGGYPTVAVPDEGVLQVTPAIVDLYVNAPDTSQPSRTRTYVLSAGSMSLSFELRDSVSGTVLFRGSDRKTDPDTGLLQWSSGVYNRSKAEMALRGWAIQLKQALDACKARGAATTAATP